MHPIKKLQCISYTSKASMLQKKSAAHQETIKLFDQNGKFLYLFLFETILEAIRIQILNRNTAFLLTLLGDVIRDIYVTTLKFLYFFHFANSKAICVQNE